MDKISVIVPICNVEKYLEKCLDSIINQTYHNLEILCMDDGSTDLSADIIDRYALKDERIRVIHKQNSGYGDTMNQAIQSATGKYIGIVESDDYIDLDMYEKLLQAMTDYNLDFVRSDFICFWTHDDGSEYSMYKELSSKKEQYNIILNPNGKIEAYLFEKFTWNALYRKSFLIENKIKYNATPGASFQDNGFWFQTMYFAKRVMFLDKAFYHYRQDNPNSSVNSDKKVFCMKNEYDYIHHILKSNHESDNRFYNICFFLRLRGYFFTLELLSNEKRLMLAKTLVDECKKYENEIDWSMFSDSEITLIESIRSNPELYVKKKNTCRDQIKSCIEEYEHIIIYGFGNYGKGLYDVIWRNSKKGTSIDYAVSNEWDIDNKYYRSSKVASIESYTNEKDSACIILAVKEGSEAFNQMKRNLKDMGFANVVLYNNLLLK